jgi:hypothetical protein
MTMKTDNPLCKCGCGKKVQWNSLTQCWNGYYCGHTPKIAKGCSPTGETGPLCACGCGEHVTWNKNYKGWNTYIHNHYGRTEEFHKSQSKVGKE